MKLLLLLVVGLVHIAIATEETDNKLSPLQASYKSLTDCQLNICKQLYRLEGLNSDADKLKFVACQSGCNINVIDGLSQCDTKCEAMYQDVERKSERDACIHSCKTFGTKKEEEKNVATLDRPSRPFINGKRPIMDIKVLDSNGNWVNPQDTQQNELVKGNDGEEVQKNVDGLFSILSSLLNRGEPNMIAIDEPEFVEQPQEALNNEETSFGKLHNFYNSIFDKMMNVMHSKMNDDQNDGGFFYYAQILSNGTVIESVKRPFIRLFGGDDNDVDRQMFNEQSKEAYHSRCHPISFNWRNMCHDTNKLFNCLSIRYGLPKWFFLSLTLVSSFLMIWMGLYILAMIRHIGRRERVFYRDIDSVDSLPLYKDLKFDEKKSFTDAPALIQDDDLQLKQKLEQA